MMRTLMLTAGVLVIVSATRADDAAAIVEKAIQATATSELRLHRLAHVVRTDRGTLFLPAGDWAAERVAYVALPDRLKYDATLVVAGQRQATIMVLNGALGWQQSGGLVQDLTTAQADALREGDLDAWSLMTLRPLRERGATIKALPTSKLNDKPVVGVALSRPGRPDSQYLFDVATGLPMRITFKMRNAGANSRELDLAEYKDFDGIRLPTRITVSQNGRKIEDWTVQSYKFPDRLDDRLFTKPK